METVARRRARPWPERPVSEANKSGYGAAAARRTLTHSPPLLVMVEARGAT